MSATPRQIRGWHVLAGLLAFFGAVIAVNVVFIVAALNTFPGEDVRRSYVQGLHYNDTLAERRAQAALGWRANAAFAGGAEGAVLEVTLRAGDAAPLDGVQLSGELQWPTDARFDRALEFQPAGAGRYLADLGQLPPGRWRLRARAQRGDRALDFESELIWRALR
jgi:nitrogen fixation protein FixH